MRNDWVLPSFIFWKVQRAELFYSNSQGRSGPLAILILNIGEFKGWICCVMKVGVARENMSLSFSPKLPVKLW